MVKHRKVSKYYETHCRLQFYQYKTRGDGYCLIHCFAKRFNETTELVLEKHWHEMNGNIETYIRFGVYKLSEDLRFVLVKNTFSLIRTIPMKPPTWSLELWQRIVKLECLFVWIKYSNIQKITLEWIFQTSSILAKLGNSKTCWSRL